MRMLSEMYVWTRNSLLNFENHPDPEFLPGSELRTWTADPDRIRLGGGLRSPSAVVLTADNSVTSL